MRVYGEDCIDTQVIASVSMKGARLNGLDRAVHLACKVFDVDFLNEYRS